MLNENFVIVGFVISMLGSIKYAVETIQGKIKPNRVTFFLWALAPLIAFAAEIKQGVGIQSLMTFGVGFSPLIIFIVSFFSKKAAWRLGWFDFICGALSLLGLLLWWISGQGIVAIAFGIIADALAALPTIVKAYHHPETENGWLFLAGAVNASLTLLTIKTWNFAHFGFPVYILIVCLIIFVLAQFKIGGTDRARTGDLLRDREAL